MILRGFVGLSAPVAYKYGLGDQRLLGPQSAGGNPILEGGVAISLIYEELWFLTRALCPLNLRDCSWVYFLDEEGLLPDISDLSIYELNTFRHNEPGWREMTDSKIAVSRNLSSFFRSQQRSYSPRNGDTLPLQIGGQTWVACFDITRVLFDSLVMRSIHHPTKGIPKFGPNGYAVR